VMALLKASYAIGPLRERNVSTGPSCAGSELARSKSREQAIVFRVRPILAHSVATKKTAQ
jgi:hypothetical protein